MREGVAVSKPPAEDGEPSNVIPFPERSVDYTGSAMKLMVGLAKGVNDLRNALDDHDKQRMRPQIRRMIDRIVEIMEMIEGHMDLLDEHHELIRDVIEPGSDAYFYSRVKTEITSLVERRNKTLMVRKLYFKGGRSGLPALEHDNDRQTLLTHEGAVACKWPRTS